MKGLFGESLNVLEKAIDLRSRRNSILAGNIANLDTPGYRSKDIPFEKIMSEYTERKPSPSQLSRTDRSHVDERGEITFGSAGILDAENMNLASMDTDDKEVLSVTDPRHFVSGDEERQGDQLQVSMERGTPNNVDIDKEMANLAENNLQYQAAVQALIKEFDLIRTAITEGGKV